MSIRLTQLKTDRDWRSATGLSETKFTHLLSLFTKTYQVVYEVDITEHQANLKKSFVFDTYQDLLFYLLFCLKNPTIYDVSGRRAEDSSLGYPPRRLIIILKKA